MKISDSKQINAENLRVIILALKMEDFNIDDEKVKNDIYDIVRRLPSPEKLNVLASDEESIGNLRKTVGYVMDLIDQYSSRDIDSKIRYKTRTGLDPRYKVLDYRSSNQEKKMNKQASDLVREMILASEEADKNGFIALSKDLIRCSKKAMDGEDIVKELSESIFNFSKRIEWDSNGFVREAQVVTPSMDFSMQAIYEGSENIVAWIDYMLQYLRDLSQIGVKSGTEKLMRQLTKIFKSLSGIRKNVEGKLQSVQQQAQSLGEQMSETVPPQSMLIQNPQDPGKALNLKIEYKEDPSDPTSQVAVVNHPDGKQYTVQQDQKTGKLILGEEYVIQNEEVAEEKAPQPKIDINNIDVSGIKTRDDTSGTTSTLGGGAEATGGTEVTSTFNKGDVITWTSPESGQEISGRITSFVKGMPSHANVSTKDENGQSVQKVVNIQDPQRNVRAASASIKRLFIEG
jgi:hypothetical protein